jgi:hypothetical protein
MEQSIKSTLKLMKYNSIDIIGSSSDTELKYFSDIDTEEFIKTKKTYEQILKFFQNKYTEAIKTPNIWVTDFKAGYYSGQPIKWSYEQIMKGERWIDDRRIKFVDTLVQQSIIKMDIVLILNDEFIELSTNYYFDFSNRNKTFDKIDKKNSEQKLLYDYRKLKETNFYKSLKRLYSYYGMIDDKDSQKILLKIFNSKLGFLNKQLNSLKTLVLLIENRYKPKKKDIIDAVLKINNKLEKYKYNVNLDNLESKSLVGVKDLINEAVEELSEVLDVDVNNFIKKSNLSHVLK